MLTIHHTLFVILVFLVLLSTSRAVDKMIKFESAFVLSSDTYEAFMNMFKQCCNSNMPKQKFAIDNVKSYINFPSKTTVGFGPKFTSNRKFFANLVSTKAFKETLNNDAANLWKTLTKKMRYCDEMVMDQHTLKDFYDKEVDQSRI